MKLESSFEFQFGVDGPPTVCCLIGSVQEKMTALLPRKGCCMSKCFVHHDKQATKFKDRWI